MITLSYAKLGNDSVVKPLFRDVLTDWQSLIPCRSTVSSERHVNPSSPDPYTTSSTLGDLLLTARVAQKCNSNLSSNSYSNSKSRVTQQIKNDKGK